MYKHCSGKSYQPVLTFSVQILWNKLLMLMLSKQSFTYSPIHFVFIISCTFGVSKFLLPNIELVILGCRATIVMPVVLSVIVLLISVSSKPQSNSKPTATKPGTAIKAATLKRTPVSTHQISACSHNLQVHSHKLRPAGEGVSPPALMLLGEWEDACQFFQNYPLCFKNRLWKQPPHIGQIQIPTSDPPWGIYICPMWGGCFRRLL